jgi:hypothetical protein
VAVNRRRQRLIAGLDGVVDTALLGGLVGSLLAGAVATVIMLETLQFGPAVGAILRFERFGQPAPLWHVDAIRVADGQHCVMKPAIMGLVHGSMVVEARLPDGRTFRVHWGGGPSSDDSGNCGSAVDLNLGLVALRRLFEAQGAPGHWQVDGL